MAKQIERKCGNCGGKVFLVTKTEKIEHPARDERGRYIYEPKLNKETGQIEERQVMVSWDVRGLGTWRCVNRCKDREVKVTRFTGAGKEAELEGDVRDRRVRSEFMKAVPVTRHIQVQYA